jgi:hypothetical protein
MEMRFRTCSALLLLLSACATTEPNQHKPKQYNQVAIPWVAPLVAPKPVVPVLPAPVGLTPPIAVMVDPSAQAQQDSEANPTPEGSGSNRAPPAPLTSERRRAQCEPRPVPHLGGDALHDWCADTFPPNVYPGNDVLVDGKRFDALQVGARVLWEIKTDSFDTYTRFLRNQVSTDQVEELRRERDLAAACGYGFVVGVSSAAHRAALLNLEPTLHIVLTGCKR